MQSIHSFTFLQRVLAADALCSVAMAAVMLLFGAHLASVFALPTGLIREAGLALVPFAAFVGWLACRTRPVRIAVWAVIAINVLWVMGSVALLLAGAVEPNAWGYGFVIVQAGAVALFAELQYIGLRNSPAALAA